MSKLFGTLAAILFVCTTCSQSLVPVIQAQASSSPIHQGPMPDERFYSLVFRHVIYLHDHDPASAVSNNSPAINAFYSDKLGATSAEAASLLTIAQDWEKDVAPVDAQAQSIIDAIHALTPGGRLKPGQSPPSVPAELLSLQKERDGITLHYVQILKDTLGSERFAQIDSSIKRNTHITMKGPKPSQLAR